MSGGGDDWFCFFFGVVCFVFGVVVVVDLLVGSIGCVVVGFVWVVGLCGWVVVDWIGDVGVGGVDFWVGVVFFVWW